MYNDAFGHHHLFSWGDGNHSEGNIDVLLAQVLPRFIRVIFTLVNFTGTLHLRVNSTFE